MASRDRPIVRAGASGIVAVSLCVALSACSDTAAPTMGQIAGSYAATELRTTESGTTADWLAAGGRIDITLTTAGATSGRIFVPGAGEDPGTDFDEDLTGSWTLSSDTVRFAHAADTFLRDVPFVVEGNDLSATFSNGGIVITVVLRK